MHEEITSHPVFPQPVNQDEQIWRYMDFAKYVAMLKDRALYFARLNELGDPFEGSLTKAEYDQLKHVAREGEAGGRLPKEWRGKYFDVLLATTRRARKTCYVNCWHINSTESEAMWRLYSSSGYAIAIASTYRLLAEALPTTHQPTEHSGPFLGIVQYIDHHQDQLEWNNVFHAVLHKRLSFKHEHECRAVINRTGPKGRRTGEPLPEHVVDAYPPGIRVPVLLEKLVQQVIISPTAPIWFGPCVADLTVRYGFAYPIRPSLLANAPYL